MAVPFENRNFQKELEKKLQELQQQDVKHLLLHSCCAPCSSYVIEYLSRYFQITVFYYNPNISAEEEYRKRVLEQQRFIKEFPAKYPVDFVEGDYEPRVFFDTAKGYSFSFTKEANGCPFHRYKEFMRFSTSISRYFIHCSLS